MDLTREMQRLMARARERMAEQDAHDVKQRATAFRIDGRHAEFCGAYREILDMLVCEIERAAEDAATSVHDWAAEAADRAQYADVMAADLADQRNADRNPVRVADDLFERAFGTGRRPGRTVPTGTGWPAK